MSAFTYEIASIVAGVAKRHPDHPEGSYALPWYLVVGNPGSGRSTALHALNLTWDGDDGPFKTGAPTSLCTYWLPKEAAFIEPGATVLGPSRQPGLLAELCGELCAARPREPIDGILLVLNVADFIDLDDTSLENWATGIRRYLVEIGVGLSVDVPVYTVITRYDAIWGFAEVFQWIPERKKEDPWGFNLPLDTPSQDSLPRVKEQLGGLNARFENFCLARLCSDDPVEIRVRAFQHLAEVRSLMDRLSTVFSILFVANSFERAPWLRAVTIGSAVPGAGGDRMRTGVARFLNMGLGQAPALQSQRPGGLPLHALMTNVILPERDLVPLRTRWREDRIIQLCAIFAGLLWAAALIAGLIFAMAAAPDNKKVNTTSPKPVKTKTAPKR
jgi:type VI protein secretion system component VasK